MYKRKRTNPSRKCRQSDIIYTDAIEWNTDESFQEKVENSKNFEEDQKDRVTSKNSDGEKDPEDSDEEKDFEDPEDSDEEKDEDSEEENEDSEEENEDSEEENEDSEEENEDSEEENEDSEDSEDSEEEDEKQYMTFNKHMNCSMYSFGSELPSYEKRKQFVKSIYQTLSENFPNEIEKWTINSSWTYQQFDNDNIQYQCACSKYIYNVCYAIYNRRFHIMIGCDCMRKNIAKLLKKYIKRKERQNRWI